MLGAVTATKAYYKRIEQTGWDLGHSVSPDDAWLGSRGLADDGGAVEAA